MSNQSTHVLIIGYVWPEPNSSAAGTRMVSLINAFIMQNWAVTFASPAALSEHRVNLNILGVDEVTIELNSSSFDDYIKQLNPNIVMFDRFMMEEQFGWRVEKFCPDALRLLDMEDCHFLRTARHKAHKKQRTVNAEDYASDIAIREIAAIYRCDLTLVISEFEMNLLQQQYQIPTELLLYSPFMLDDINNELPAYSDRQHFISIGNFRHEPNWDAVLWLKQQIWPLIRKQLPTAEIHIYGAYPPKKATDLHTPQQGFYVDGWVEDAAVAMQSALVCLAPLRFGAGLKGKLLEAMQYGTPSVTTCVGAEGMAGDLAWNGEVITLNNNPEAAQDIANAAVALYQQADKWQQAQQQGTAILQQRFTSAVHLPVLIDKLMHINTNLTNHRLLNFTGAMLRHHSMKSTQYMAQWIEAKNK